MAEQTGLSKRSCQNAAAHLQRRELIEIRRKAGTEAGEYIPVRPWARV
jgi:DNA-binding FadR family transcriptional regulator